MRAMVLTRARRRIAFHFQKSAAIHMRRHSCVPGSSGTGHIALAGQGLRMGVYGFGAAAHIITQVALHQRREVYAFAAPVTIRRCTSRATSEPHGRDSRTNRRPARLTVQSSSPP